MSYLAFSLLFVALALVPVAGAMVRQRTGRRWWRAVLFSMVVLLVLTVIFDSLMVHVDLFRYDQSRSLGLDVLLTPVEDLAWPVAAALLVPSLWVLTPSARPARRPAPRPRRRQRAAQLRRRRRS